MSALSERVAAQHWMTLNNGWHCVGCGYNDFVEANAHGYTNAERRHLADVTERAVREAIYHQLEKVADRHSDEAVRHRDDSRSASTPEGRRSHMNTAHARRNKAEATYDAARIAREGTTP